MNEFSLLFSEAEYNAYFHALMNIESAACFGVRKLKKNDLGHLERCLLYTSPSPRD